MELNYDDHDAHHAAFAEKVCGGCGYKGAHFTGPGAGPHYATVTCDNCGKGEWLPWPPRSKEEQKRKRSKPLTILETDVCWWCGRDKAACALLGLKLERAHTVERSRLIEAGLPADDPLNVPVLCSECHPEQHRKREAVARYEKALGLVER